MAGSNWNVRLATILLSTLALSGRAPQGGMFAQDPLGESETQIPRLLEMLRSDSIDTRVEAEGRLKKCRREELPILRRAMNAEMDSEVRLRVQMVLNDLLRVRIRLELSENRVPLGHRVTIARAALINDKCEAITLILPLAGSASYRQLPIVDYEVETPSGEIKNGHRQYERTGHINPPTDSDCVSVPPGQSLELLKFPEGGESWFAEWTPDRAGLYRLRLLYDSSPKDWIRWITDEPFERGEGCSFGRLARHYPVPSSFPLTYHGRVVSEWVSFTVVEKE